MERLLEPETLAIIFLFGTPVFAVIGFFIYQVFKTRSDNELKRLMVEQGMSADEIERVLAAGSDKKKKE